MVFYEKASWILRCFRNAADKREEQGVFVSRDYPPRSCQRKWYLNIHSIRKAKLRSRNRWQGRHETESCHEWKYVAFSSICTRQAVSCHSRLIRGLQTLSNMQVTQKTKQLLQRFRWSPEVPVINTFAIVEVNGSRMIFVASVYISLFHGVIESLGLKAASQHPPPPPQKKTCFIFQVLCSNFQNSLTWLFCF